MDYWAFFKELVKAQISPSEAWRLDYQEVHTILNLKTGSVSSDVSMMINAERKANGAKDERYFVR